MKSYRNKGLASLAVLLSFLYTQVIYGAIAVSWPPIGGTSYSVPQAGETGWANLTNYLVALQNAQGTTSQKVSVRTATATPVTVVSSTDAIVVVNLGTPGASTVDLPAGVAGQYFAVVDGKGDAATNNITVDPNSTQTINGASTYVINKNKAAIIFAFDGTEWKIYGEFNSLSSGGSILINPMTTAGDLIYGGASGVPTRLVAGTSGQVLQTGSTPSWVGTLTMADGTAGAPSYSFLSGPTNGSYLSGTNEYSVATNGTQRLKITTGSFTTTIAQRTIDGSNSNPGYSFASDSDTGVFRKGTGNVGFTADGTEIASYGPLGQWTYGIIGSTNAGLTYRYYVPVAASTTPSSVVTSPYLEFTSQGSNGVPGLLGNQNGSSADSGLMFIAATKDGNTSGDMRFDARENDNSTFATLTNNAFRWSSFGTNLMTLTRGGVASIGQTSGVASGHIVYGVANNAVAGLSVYSPSVSLGATSGTVTRTNTSNKTVQISVPHYTIAEEEFGLVNGQSVSANNILSLGGGSSSYNAATSIEFYTAATTTTVTGTLSGKVANDNTWTLGNTAKIASSDYPGQKIVGKTDGVATAAGYVGEIKNVVATLTDFPSSNTYGDLGSLSLTPGSWIVSFTCGAFVNGATVTAFDIGIGTASGSGSTGLVAGDNQFFGLPPSATSQTSISIADYPINITSTTTYYAKVRSSYSVATPQYRGRMTAIRIN